MSPGESAVEDDTLDQAVDTSISDDVDGDLDLIASKTKGHDYVEQDN